MPMSNGHEEQRSYVTGPYARGIYREQHPGVHGTPRKLAPDIV
jgi:hypothetical protein